MLLPANFPATKPLVAARFFTVFEHDVHDGDKIAARPLGDETNSADRDDKGVMHLDMDLAMRLWLALYIIEAKDFSPTPIETAEQESQRVVQLESLDGGWFLITAPWMAEGEKVQGKDAAEARRDAIVAKGDTKGVTIEQNGSWYTVSAPWLDEPIKVQGAEAAAVEEHMLIEDGPPEGWVPETAEAKADRIQAAADAQAAAEEAERQRVADEQAAAEQAERDALARAQANGAFVMEATGGGWHSITGPGLTEAVRVKGKDAAEAKLTELRDAAQAAADQASTTDANGANQANPQSGVDEASTTANSGAVTAEVTGAANGDSAPPLPAEGELGSTTGSEPAKPQGDGTTDQASQEG